MCLILETEVDTQHEKLSFDVTENEIKEASEEDNTFYEKCNEYRSSFTVHGLSRALTGNFFEKFFWGIILLLSFSIIIYAISTLIVKFKKNDVYIKFVAKEYSEADTPIITICPSEVNKRGTCNLTIHCIENVTLSPLIYKKNSSYSWQNDIISIVVENSSKNSVKAGVQLTDYIVGTYYGCVRVNINFFVRKTSTSNRIHVNTVYPQKQIQIFVHDTDELYPFFQGKSIYMVSKESDEMNIELKKYKRLKQPFASNCTQSSESIIFPGKYSKMKCIESLKCINSRKACGHSYDFCEELLSKDCKVEKNISSTYEINNLTECLITEYGKKYDNECALPCEESVYTVITSFNTNQGASIQDNTREIWINFPISPYYHAFEEAPLYSFVQFLSDCGGFLGLLIGCSAVSLLEVMAFLSLTVLRKVFNKKKQK